MSDQQMKTERQSMHNFTIEVSIPDSLRERFEARVRAHGGDERQYVREVVERDLQGEAPSTSMSLSDLLSLASGPTPADQLSEAELAEFAEAEVKAHRAEKRQDARRG